MKLLAGVLTLVALAFTGVSFAAGAKHTSGVAYVSATHAEGSTLFVSGDFKDKVLGRGGIVYQTKVTGTNTPGTFLVTAKVITIFTNKGSLTGSGKGTQTTAQDGTTSVSDGTFKLTKGTGAYKGHTLKGTFAGPLKDGIYKFSYTGTYK
jgi:hypothetical protein